MICLMSCWKKQMNEEDVGELLRSAYKAYGLEPDEYDDPYY